MAAAMIYRTILEEKGMKPAQLEKAAQLGVGAVSKAIHRNSSIQIETARKIKQLFPEYNLNWLMYGTGAKLDRTGLDKSEKVTIVSDDSPAYGMSEVYDLGSYSLDEPTEKNKAGNEFIDIGSGRFLMMVPLVHEYAYAGYMAGFGDTEFIEDLPRHPVVVEERHRGVYRAFIAKGESMSNDGPRSIESGDIVVGRRVEKHLWQHSKLHLHKFQEFIIHTRQGIVVKQVLNHDVANGTLLLHSYNPSFSDTTISVDEVVEIFNVVQVTKPR